MTTLTLSTLIDEGHAILQSPQSIQFAGFLFILFGLSKDVMPSNAP